MVSLLMGRECEAGWGYNAKDSCFISEVQTNGLKTISFNYTTSGTTYFDFQRYKFFDYIFTQNKSNIIELIVKENQNIYKFMDFVMENHKTTGFISGVWCFSKEKTAEKPNNYPSQATHFVHQVYYGLGMWIILDNKNNHLFENSRIPEFLDQIWSNERKLTEEQKNVLCSVLIFSPNPETAVIKKMPMNEILKLLEDFRNGKVFDREIAVCYNRTNLTEDSYVLDSDRLDARFSLLVNQLSDIYWFKKILENKTTMPMYLNNLSVFNDIYPKIKNKKNANFWLEKMTNIWDQKINQYFEIIGGSKITESELSLELFIEQINEIYDDFIRMLRKKRFWPSG